MRLGEIEPNETCPTAYRRPQPQLTFGQAVARHVPALMDVSDGPLIDAQPMAAASAFRFGLLLDSAPTVAALLAVRHAVSIGGESRRVIECVYVLYSGVEC